MNIINRNNDQINVCIISKWFYPTLIGPGERFRRYSNGLKQRGINLSVITMQLDGQSEIDEIEGISIRRIPIQGNSKLVTTKLLKEGLKVIKREKHKPDVIQLLNHSLYNFPYIYWGRLLGIPFIFIYTMTKTKKMKPIYYRVKDNISLRLKYYPLNRVVTSSTVMSQNLISHGVPEKNITTIPNGVDTLKFKKIQSVDERNDLRLKLGFKENDELILFVGMTTHRKGIDILVSAWDKIATKRKNAKLIFVGHRVDNTNEKIPIEFRDQVFMDMIDEIIQNSCAPDRAVFVDNKNNIEEYMKMSDIFVFPSRVEGMPNVVPEAMACGLPCVLAPFIGFPKEFGRAEKEYILVNHDFEQFADKVIQVLENDSLQNDLRTNALSWVKKYLEINKSLDKYEKLYREIAENENEKYKI